MSTELKHAIFEEFPLAPYPGDRVLSDCWCGECAYELRNLRGKTWYEASSEDLRGRGGWLLQGESKKYYFPTLLQGTLDDDEYDADRALGFVVESLISVRFTFNRELLARDQSYLQKVQLIIQKHRQEVASLINSWNVQQRRVIADVLLFGRHNKVNPHDIHHVVDNLLLRRITCWPGDAYNLWMALRFEELMKPKEFREFISRFTPLPDELLRC